MSGTNDTRAVNGEDWHKAHEIICDVRDASARVPEDADSGDILDALIEHGWGPKPMVSDLKQMVAEELRSLVDRAFPDGEESDYHYGCEALLEHVQDRIEQLRPTREGS